MLRSFVVTFTIAVLLAISHSIADAQYHYRVEHSWEPRYKGIPSIMMDVARTRLTMQHMKEIERIKASNQKASSQNVHVHITPPTNTRQSPSWTEYQEMANTLRETQLALVSLEAEIANLRAPRTETVSTKKVVPPRQPRISRQYKPATRKGVDRNEKLEDAVRRRLHAIGIPGYIIYEVVKAKLHTPFRSEAIIVHDSIFEHSKLSYAQKVKFWARYTSRQMISTTSPLVLTVLL